MESNREFEDKLWKAIASDRTVMLGLDGVEDGHARPMTAQLDNETGPTLWFFTATDNALCRRSASARAARWRRSWTRATTCSRR